MKVMTIFGTRPEMIKMWGVLKKLDDMNFEHVMVHTGQNYTKELKDFFFNDLELREPDYQLNIDVSSNTRLVTSLKEFQVLAPNKYVIIEKMMLMLVT